MKIKIWSARTGEHMRNLSGHRGAITCLCLIDNDAKLCSGSLDGTVIIWDLVDHDIIWTIKINQPVNSSFRCKMLNNVVFTYSDNVCYMKQNDRIFCVLGVSQCRKFQKKFIFLLCSSKYISYTHVSMYKIFYSL